MFIIVYYFVQQTQKQRYAMTLPDAMIPMLSIDSDTSMNLFLCFLSETISIFMNVTKQDKHHSITHYQTLMSFLCPEKLVLACNLLANFEIYNVHGYIML